MIIVVFGGSFALSGLLGLALARMVPDPPAEMIHQDIVLC